MKTFRKRDIRQCLLSQKAEFLQLKLLKLLQSIIYRGKQSC